MSVDVRDDNLTGADIDEATLTGLARQDLRRLEEHQPRAAGHDLGPRLVV